MCLCRLVAFHATGSCPCPDVGFRATGRVRAHPTKDRFALNPPLHDVDAIAPLPTVVIRLWLKFEPYVQPVHRLRRVSKPDRQRMVFATMTDDDDTTKGVESPVRTCITVIKQSDRKSRPRSFRDALLKYPPPYAWPSDFETFSLHHQLLPKTERLQTIGAIICLKH